MSKRRRPGEDGLHHAIHSDLLIVTLALVDRVVELSEQLIDLRVGQPDRRSVAAPEVVGSRIIYPILFEPGKKVELDDFLPVSRVRELEPEHRRVVLRLLEAVGRQPIVGFGLDHREREVARVAQQVIDTLGWPADEALARRHDAPVSDGALLGDRVRLGLPAGGLEFGDDELSTGVGFVHPQRGTKRTSLVSTTRGRKRIHRRVAKRRQVKQVIASRLGGDACWMDSTG